MLLAVAEGHTATRDRLRGHLGVDRDRPMAEAYFRQTCTRARALLGTAGDGRPRVLYGNGCYSLHPDVAIDWDDFQALAADTITDDKGRIENLKQALSLVRGQPFEDRCYQWLDPILIEHIRTEIIRAAIALADLSHNDPVTAAWAACRGLLADPYAEPLYRTLMATSHALGHTRRIHLAYQLCEQALVQLDLRPHQQTIALYRRLVHCGRA